MRRDGIPYVSNGVYNPPFPAIPLQDMTLEEIKKKYLKMCGKANGDPAVCSKCSTPCAEGKRAIQLLSNQVYNDPPIPLYGGKTLIEKAREENMLRRQKLEESKREENKMAVKRVHSFNAPENWYEESLASGDQVKWMMDHLGISKTQAKKKIYSYRYRNGLTNKEYFTKGQGDQPPVISNSSDNTHVQPEDKMTVNTSVKEYTSNNVSENISNTSDSIEGKIDRLMREQSKYKQIMDDHYKEYLAAKELHDKLTQKIDVLCSAMDIMNE